MAGQKRTWRDKLYGNGNLPKVEPITVKMSKRWGRGTMVTPAPAEVDEIMWMVPQGKLITIGRIQEMIAKKHDADVTCPVMTGMSAWIAAQAAADDEAEGRNKVTPYWRTLKTDGELNPKYPGGIEGQKARLEAEGHRVVRKGNKHIVHNYEGALVVW